MAELEFFFFGGGGRGSQPYFYRLYLKKCSMVIGNIKNLKYMGVLAVVTPLHLVVLNLIIHGKKKHYLYCINYYNYVLKLN